MTPTEEKQRVRAPTEVLTTPIVYHPGGWEDTVPEWLKKEVLKQRIEKLVDGGWDEATDAEVLCYLMTASLAMPLSSDWALIYMYEAATLMPHLREVIPDTPKELSEYQKSELRDIKLKIRDSQIRRRKSKKKESNMAKRKLLLDEHDVYVVATVGQEGCDPIDKRFEGTLEEILPGVPDLLKEAAEKWAVSPKNPSHTPPAAQKPAPAPATKAEDLPLLSGTETAQPAGTAAEDQASAPTEEQEKVPIGGLISIEEAIAVAEGMGGSREELEAPPEAGAEVTEPPAAPAAVEPEAEVPAPVPSEPAKPGEWEYWLQDGRGPFGTVQVAMDELGLDKENRPLHNRWDRLSTSLKERIQRRPKA